MRQKVWMMIYGRTFCKIFLPTCIVLVPVVPEAVEPIPTRERVGTVTVVVESEAAFPPRENMVMDRRK